MSLKHQCNSNYEQYKFCNIIENMTANFPSQWALILKVLILLYISSLQRFHWPWNISTSEYFFHNCKTYQILVAQWTLWAVVMSNFLHWTNDQRPWHDGAIEWTMWCGLNWVRLCCCCRSDLSEKMSWLSVPVLDAVSWAVRRSLATLSCTRLMC